MPKNNFLSYSKNLLLKGFVITFIAFLLHSFSWAMSEKPSQELNRPYAGYVNPDYWNLSIGGSIQYGENLYPRLIKPKDQQEEWSAIIRLSRPLDLSAYIGNKLYFITEAQAKDNYRLAPTFFVTKKGTRYDIWWVKSNKDLSRKYITFTANENGSIKGSIDIPDTEDSSYIYIAKRDGKKQFIVKSGTELTLKDIKNSLQSDWQHDIPGKYSYDDKTFPGSFGTIIFKHFYVGLAPLVPVLPANSWIKELTIREKEILSSEFEISFSKGKIKPHQYILDSNETDKIKKYFFTNKSFFNSHPYFQKHNFISGGDIPKTWKVIAKTDEEKISISNGKFVLNNKNNPNTWTIIKIDEISSLLKLERMRGVVRLSAEMQATNLIKGDLPWQNVILEAILRDKNGQQINRDQNLCTLPLDFNSQKNQNISGTFVDEFIIGPDVTSIEIVVKIAGAPDNDPNKKGISLSELIIDKIALQKTNQQIDLDKLLTELSNKKILLSSGKYKVYKQTQHGLVVGDRQFSVKDFGNSNFQIKYNIKDANQYAGIYSKIFDLHKINELEVAADFTSNVDITGTLPSWASLTLQINYFDENGAEVYTADYGSERYPKIFIDPHQKNSTQKSFFHVPQERGATYGQIRIHVIRKSNDLKNGFDQENYLTGELTVSNIIVRPSLKFTNNKNHLPNNGNFYKHINGKSLTWDFNGVNIKENLIDEVREIIFDNNSKDWSAMKTAIKIPKEAQLARGKLKIDITDMDTGVAQWQGFGFFLEADVVDNTGNSFHFSGIPVYQRLNNKLVRLERIPKQYNGIIDFYIPLYHEQLKIKKLYFQIALAGKGYVRLLPLQDKKNSPLIELDLLSNPEQPDIAAFWSQYSLFAAEKDNIYFQKNYRMAYNKHLSNYEYAETLIDHVISKEKSAKINKTILESLKVNETTMVGTAKIRALPSYARVSKEFILPKNFDYILVDFHLDTNYPEDTKYNFRVELRDNKDNVHAQETYTVNENGNWSTVTGEDTFNYKPTNRFMIPIRKGLTKAHIVFGNNQGELQYSNIRISALKGVSSVPIAGNIAQKELQFNSEISLYKARDISEYKFTALENKSKAVQTDTELYAIEKLLMGNLAVNKNILTAKQDRSIRNSIKNGSVYAQKGTWYYRPNKPFTPVGFTIVGETFNKWFELRRKEYNSGKPPYWLKFLKSTEKKLVISHKKEDDYILSYARAQANIWQRMGINYIRVHQLFASWSGLDKDELAMVIDILRIWQKEKGMLIDYDLLPNPNLSSDFFADILQGKPLTADLSNNINLFKTSLVLPNVSKEYIEPAIEKIAQLFVSKDFWPNTISYCNETGFTHGYWLIDHHNPNHHPKLSEEYQAYYTSYLAELEKMPTMRSDINKIYTLFQSHLEIKSLNLLLDKLLAINSSLYKKERVKDISGYIYYNLLRDDEINKYKSFKAELKKLKTNGYKYLATASIDSQYYPSVLKIAKRTDTEIQRLKQQLRLNEIANARKLELFLTSAGFKQNIARLTAKTISNKEYKEQDFDYIDSFTLDNEKKLYQSFFTSFILQNNFEKNINSLLLKYSKRNRLIIGLNNDYIKDPFSILQRSYAFSNSDRHILRFNKYSHHPVGGHSMLLNAGAGNVFDIDSKIHYNLTLFNPLYSLGYPLCLSETNHTYAGGLNSGKGNWSFIDQLKALSGGHTILGFRYGLTNIDKPLISDYFNMANRPNKISQFNLLAYVAEMINTGQTSLSEDEFSFNPYNKISELNNRSVQALAGEIKKNQTISNKTGDFKFTYRGSKEIADITMVKTVIGKESYLVSFYGIERNNNQINRADNDNLVQSFGEAPIKYEYFPGTIKIKVNRWSRYKVVGYYADSATPVTLSKGNYQQTGDVLKVFLLSKNKGLCYFKIIKL